MTIREALTQQNPGCMAWIERCWTSSRLSGRSPSGRNIEFGSLWNSWLDAIMAAVKGLKDNQGSALPIEELAERAQIKVANLK